MVWFTLVYQAYSHDPKKILPIGVALHGLVLFALWKGYIPLPEGPVIDLVKKFYWVLPVVDLMLVNLIHYFTVGGSLWSQKSAKSKKKLDEDSDLDEQEQRRHPRYIELEDGSQISDNDSNFTERYHEQFYGNPEEMVAPSRVRRSARGRRLRPPPPPRAPGCHGIPPGGQEFPGNFRASSNGQAGYNQPPPGWYSGGPPPGHPGGSPPRGYPGGSPPRGYPGGSPPRGYPGGGAPPGNGPPLRPPPPEHLEDPNEFCQTGGPPPGHPGGGPPPGQGHPDNPGNTPPPNIQGAPGHPGGQPRGPPPGHPGGSPPGNTPPPNLPQGGPGQPPQQNYGQIGGGFNEEFAPDDSVDNTSIADEDYYFGDEHQPNIVDNYAMNHASGPGPIEEIDEALE